MGTARLERHWTWLTADTAVWCDLYLEAVSLAARSVPGNALVVGTWLDEDVVRELARAGWDADVPPQKRTLLGRMSMGTPSAWLYSPADNVPAVLSPLWRDERTRPMHVETGLGVEDPSGRGLDAVRELLASGSIVLQAFDVDSLTISSSSERLVTEVEAGTDRAVRARGIAAERR